MANEDEDSTPQLGSALRDELAKQLEAAPEAPASEEPTTAVEPKAADAPEETPSDGSETVAPSDEGLKPLENWSEADKEAFKALDPTGQEFLLRREKEMTADYTAKSTKLADARKFHESFSPVIETYEPVLNHYGMTPEQAFQSLMNAQVALDRNPVEGIKALIAGYKVDPKSILGEPSDKFVDPETSALEKKIADLEGKLNRYEQTTQLSKAQQVSDQIETFRTAKDTAGNALYPHFDKVEASMAKIIQSGLAKDLPTAYEKAVRADDELFQQTLKAREAEALKKRDEEARQNTDKAKTLGASNVKGRNVPTGAKKPASLREELEANYQ